MANFNSFKITDSGLDLLYKAQTGEKLEFSKFVLGDGNYSGSIRDLTNLINPIKDEPITRMTITGNITTKKLIIGFDLNNTNVTNGFYLREIGIFAKDPDTDIDTLVYYTNSGDTADYIPASSTDTIITKLLNAELYISDVAEITATIDSSLVYASQTDIANLRTELINIIGEIDIPTKTSDLEKDDVYTKQEVDNAISNNTPDLTGYAKKNELATVATSGSYDDLSNLPIVSVNSEINFVDGQHISLSKGLYYIPSINLLKVNGTSINSLSIPVILEVHSSTSASYTRKGASMSSAGTISLVYEGIIMYSTQNNTWQHSEKTISHSTTDLTAGSSSLASGSIYLVYE